MTRTNVVVTDPIMASGLDELGRHFTVTRLYDLPEERRADALADAEALVVRKFRVDSTVFDKAPRLRAVVRHGAGYDDVDVVEATRRGVAVATTPVVGAAAVAEHAVMQILMACRDAVGMHRAVLDDDFAARDRWRPMELRGKRVGVVGFGPIGRYVAGICRDGFGTEIVVYDPLLLASDVPVDTAGVTVAASLAELLETADVVTVHAALTDKTRGMIGSSELDRMKDGSVLVCTARGGIIDEDALAAALASGKLAGAALDVFDAEPPDTSRQLFGRDRVAFSPHIAGLTKEAAEGLSLAAARAVVTVLVSGEDPDGLINPDYHDHTGPKTASAGR